MSCGPPPSATETIPLAHTHAYTATHTWVYRYVCMYRYMCVSMYVCYYGNHVISFHCNAIEFFPLRSAVLCRHQCDYDTSTLTASVFVSVCVCVSVCKCEWNAIFDKFIIAFCCGCRRGCPGRLRICLASISEQRKHFPLRLSDLPLAFQYLLVIIVIVVITVIIAKCIWLHHLLFARPLLQWLLFYTLYTNNTSLVQNVQFNAS